MRFKFTDFHVHTRDWSIDVADDGPTFEDYIKVAEKHRINVCFLDHYELYYIENDKTNPFYGGKIDDYLEEIDNFKETYDFILSGLEVEYYEDKEIQLLELMDDYRKELDFIGGSIHEWIIGYPITTKEGLTSLLEKKPIKQIIDEYFRISEKSKIVVGRNQRENEVISSLRREGDTILTVESIPGPTVLATGDLSPEEIEVATSMTVSYSDATADQSVAVRLTRDSTQWTLLARGQGKRNTRHFMI